MNRRRTLRRRYGHARELPAAGGLKIVKRESDFGRTRYEVVHASSGLGIGLYAFLTLKEAKIALAAVVPLFDWTISVDDFGVAMGKTENFDLRSRMLEAVRKAEAMS